MLQECHGEAQHIRFASSSAASTTTNVELNELNMEQLFSQHASVLRGDSRYMNEDDFLNAIAPQDHFYSFSKNDYAVLFRLADRQNRGVVSQDDFAAFYALLEKPDAEYQIAYKVFDTARHERITVGDLKRVLSASSAGKSSDVAAFDPNNSETLKILAGRAGDKREVPYTEFSELVKALQSERLLHEFKQHDPKATGYVSPSAFQKIMTRVAGHRLNPSVIDKLASPSFVGAGAVEQQIPFSLVRATYQLLQQLDVIESLMRESAKDGRVSKADFHAAAARSLKFTAVTPLELDVLFRLAGDDGRIAVDAFQSLFRPKQHQQLSASVGEQQQVQQHNLSVGMEILKNMYNFLLGSIAGAIGATVVYPIDLVKTRMQNQRSNKFVGQLMYKNSWECFQKVIKNEGVLGLYSGLIPQLVGVAPEKAIKLTVNDFVRSKMRDPKTRELPLWGEILAGCCAGGSQVIFTNPLEIVKIRLQVAGEASKGALDAVPKPSALTIVRHLGLVGLYKGAGACLLRDIPFSGIYFPVYAHLKTGLFDEGVNGKKLAGWE
ncbi:mitochondrial aspartate-glutamate transporter agc1, partial [Quaeritorhiza haematococci]